MPSFSETLGIQDGVWEHFDRLFYSFNLDEHVPADHLLRRIDHFLDLSVLQHHLEPFYCHTGRPSVDPELMIRMLLVGYFEYQADYRGHMTLASG